MYNRYRIHLKTWAQKYNIEGIHMKQIALNLPEEWIETLDERKNKIGIDRSNQIRRAIAKEVDEI